LFCSGRNALQWKEIWTTWRYSEVVEFVINRNRQIQKDLEDIEGADIEYAEQLTTTVLLKILQKI
jgi:hypothetical protein